MQKKGTDVGYGVVLMMDVLGARSSNMEMSHEMVKKLDSFKTACEKHYHFVLEDSKKAYKSLAGSEEGHITPMHRCFLGDTFIYVFRFRKDNYMNESIASVSFFSNILTYFITALCNNLVTRGAISVGEYIISQDEYTLLGPAVSDAAAWCEAADWAGLHFTPSACMHIEKIRTVTDFKAISQYTVPLSRKMKERRMKLWCINWPRSYCLATMEYCRKNNIYIHDGDDLFYQARLRLINTLSAGTHSYIPSGVESKIINTLDFFDKNKTENILELNNYFT